MYKLNKHFNNRLHNVGRRRMRSEKFNVGAAPGLPTISEIDSETEIAPAKIEIISYNEEGLLAEQKDLHLNQLSPNDFPKDQINWIHIQGKPNTEQLKRLGDLFKLHTLALEDVQHSESRPKTESYEHHQFIVLKKIWDENNIGINSSQVSFFLNPNFVISIDESDKDDFEPVRRRLRNTKKICQQGPDYLLYALIDVITDNGFNVLDTLGDKLEDLENQVLDEPTKETRNKIHFLKRELLMLHKIWWPQREVITSLLREDQDIISSGTKLFLRDTYDHCVIQLDFVETYREISTSLLETYLSAINQRMNDIMKGLTIVATIFLPLTFLSGLYGMNFDTDSPWNMPELAWKFGYLYVLLLMLLVAIGMLVFFRKKNWL